MKWLIGILLFLPLLAMAADDMQRALDAFNKADYAEAMKIWQSESDRGNSVARFNLAYLHRNGMGTATDEEKALNLIRHAAHEQLVDAYVNIAASVLQPSTRKDSLQSMAVTDPQIWVKTQEGKHYTLQLASSRSQDLIEKYFRENNLEGKAGYYKSRRQGDLWYALVFGSYKSVSDANDAIASLPSDLRKWSPWVRRIDSIHKITVP